MTGKMGKERLREESTGLPYFKFTNEKDFSDPENLANFWSFDPDFLKDEVLARVGRDKIFYVGGCLPIPESLGNRCGDCRGFLTESRDIVGHYKNKTLVRISRECHGSCVESRMVLGRIQVPSYLIHECILMVIFPQFAPC